MNIPWPWLVSFGSVAVALAFLVACVWYESSRWRETIEERLKIAEANAAAAIECRVEWVLDTDTAIQQLRQSLQEEIERIDRLTGRT